MLLLGLLLTGGLYASLAPASADETASTAELVEQGRELFITGCSTCHGENGEGVRNADGSNLGPSLVGVGAASAHFQLSTGRMPAAGPAAQVPRKEPVYTADEIQALSAYIASLGPGPGSPTPEDYLLPEDLTEEERQEQISIGAQVFWDNCTACHNFNGSGGAMPNGGEAVPINNREGQIIYEAMLTGPQTMDVFSNGNITPEEKRAVIAYLQSIEEQPEYGGFGMGSLGPVSDGVFVWVVGIGSLVLATTWIAAHTTRSKKNKKVEA